jgi:hypothetical protein
MQRPGRRDTWDNLICGLWEFRKWDEVVEHWAIGAHDREAFQCVRLVHPHYQTHSRSSGECRNIQNVIVGG